MPPRRILPFLALALAARAQQLPPPALLDMVPNRSHAGGQPHALGTQPCLAVKVDGRPFLVWDPAAPLPVPRDPDAAAAWLAAHAGDLGHGAFTPVSAGTREWRGGRVLVFGLAHDGVPLHDAEVRIHFDRGGAVGIVNRVPAGLDRPPPRPQGAADPVFAVVRGEEGRGDRLVVAERRHAATPHHDVLELVVGGSVVARELTQRAHAAPAQAVQFTEFAFGGFPDQIAADSRGTIWCSDPNGNRLLAIDPQTGTATFHATTPWGQPDGLCVDDQDRVWTGFYTGGHGLGRLDPQTHAITRWAPPYAGAAMAIPTWTHDGRIWITDHAANRLSEFDSATGAFAGAIALPAGTYPVGAAFEPETGDLFVTFWTRNAIGQVRSGALLRTLPTPVLAGPAFCAAANGKVWFTYWSTPQLGVLDIASATFTTLALPPGEQGGPIDIGPNGHVYVGTRGRGYVVDFDPTTLTSVAHAIPTPSPGLKDGLTVAPDGTVWCTGSYTGRVVRLRLP